MAKFWRIALVALSLPAVTHWHPVSSEASPPAAPFVLSLTPTLVRPGDRIQIRLEPKSPIADLRGAPLFDLYIAIAEEKRSLLFLAADGDWSPTPSPFLTARSPALPLLMASSVINQSVSRSRATVAVGFVEPGRDPLAPVHWVYTPLTADLRVSRPLSVGAREWGIAVALAIACVGAIVLVLRS